MIRAKVRIILQLPTQGSPVAVLQALLLIFLN